MSLLLTLALHYLSQQLDTKSSLPAAPIKATSSTTTAKAWEQHVWVLLGTSSH